MIKSPSDWNYLNVREHDKSKALQTKLW
jgi:hypothetical protein